MVSPIWLLSLLPLVSCLPAPSLFLFGDSLPSFKELLTRPSGRPLTISVEGNVGAGKSTLLNYFKQHSQADIFLEPLEIWQNLNGTNFLDLTYSDAKRWGMTFESLVLLTMAEEHLANKRPDSGLTDWKPLKVMERSVHSARACFIENLAPVMTPGERAVLDSWYSLLTTDMDMEVDLVIYLRTSPQVALARVQGRSRDEEMQIPGEFFTNMHQLHEDWLIHRNSSAQVTSPRVLVINADEDISVLTRTYSKLARMIVNMVTP